jgi:hypothetical protein
MDLNQLRENRKAKKAAAIQNYVEPKLQKITPREVAGDDFFKQMNTKRPKPEKEPMDLSRECYDKMKENSILDESSSSFQTRSPLLAAALRSPDFESFIQDMNKSQKSSHSKVVFIGDGINTPERNE